MILLQPTFTIRKNWSDTINIHCLKNQKYTANHSHEFIELVYVCSGSAEYHIDKNTGTLKAGDFFVIDYGTTHDYTSKCGNLTIINCLFLPEIIDKTFAGIRNFNKLAEQYFMRIMGRQISSSISNRVFHDDGTVGELLLKMLDEFKNKNIGYFEIMRCILSQIIIETIRKVGSKTAYSQFTTHIIKEIDRKFALPLTLSEICSDLHISLSYASARFKADTGITFSHCLQNRRIKEACQLLCNTDMPVTRIAETVGYDNIKFFNKTFKKFCQTSPLKYRKNSFSYYL